MICSNCLRTRFSLRFGVHFQTPLSTIRLFSGTGATYNPAQPPPATPVFTTPLSKPTPKARAAVALPISFCAAGTKLKGLNYLKGRDDPVALPEEDYPEWLWRCLDVKKSDEEGAGEIGDEFGILIQFPLSGSYILTFLQQSLRKFVEKQPKLGVKLKHVS